MLDVSAGESIDKHIVCAEDGPEQVSVRVGRGWPDDLEGRRLVLYLPFRFVIWKRRRASRWQQLALPLSAQSRTVLFGPSDR